MSTDATTVPLKRTDAVGALVRQRLAAVGRPRVRPVVQARIGLALILAASFFIVLAAAGRPSFLSATTQAHYFPAWMAGPLGGLAPALTALSSLRWLITIAIALAFAGYLIAVKHAHHLRISTVAAVLVAVHIVYVLAPPLALTDVFNYLNYARMEVVHHLNPYTTIPQLEPHSDPAFALSNWHGLLSPYGPLFTILTFALAPLTLAAYFWTFKVAIMVTELGIVFLTWRCAKLLEQRPLAVGPSGAQDSTAIEPSGTMARAWWRATHGQWTRARPSPIDPVAAVVLVGFNPIVLFWGLGGDHNDFFTIFFVLLGFYLLLRARAADLPAAAALETLAGARRRLVSSGAAFDVAAGAAFVAAAGLKASAGLLIPAVLASLLGSRRRLLTVLSGMAVAGVVVAVATVVAFGVHFPNLTLQNSLVINLSIPNLLGLALAQGGETGMLRDALNLTLVAAVAACAVLALRRREPISGAGWVMVAVLVTLSWVLPWYVVWVLPMAALSGSRRLRGATIALCVYFIVAWAPVTAQILGAIGFHPQHTYMGRVHAKAVDELLYGGG
jgi:hypothetical protein